MGLQIQDRDIMLIKTISRWRFLTSKQIKQLCGFKGQRSCDRRLAKLIEANYITRKHYIYGVSRLYTVTPKAYKTFALAFFTPHIRTEQIVHDISVIDTAIYCSIVNRIDTVLCIFSREQD